MNNLRDLYQEVIFDHNRRPRNRGPLATETHHAEGHNPLCGDRVTIHVQLQNGILQEIRFEGEGCAISTASASLMTEAMKGKTLAEVQQLFDKFHLLVTSGTPEHELGKLEALGGVREFPMRVKCATLPWHTLNAALLERPEKVSTE